MQNPALGRRGVLKGLLAMTSALALGRGLVAASDSGAEKPAASGPWTRFPATLSGFAHVNLPEGKRFPRGIAGVQLDAPGSTPTWRWTQPTGDRPIQLGRLRFSAALDFREERKIEARLAKSGESLGFFDVRFAYALQPFELVISGTQATAALREGVVLLAGEGKVPLWIVDGDSPKGDRGVLAPHLLAEFETADPVASFLAETATLGSLQPFGWLEGCVLDGLQDLSTGKNGMAARAALDRHIRQYVNDDGSLVYEDLRGQSADGRFPGIESTLPMGVIVAQRPGHPLIETVLQFWETKRTTGNIICDGKLATAEGSYTIGYPLAVIAVQRGRKDLAELALRQITARIELLPLGDDLYLRCPLNGTGRTFGNWARAYAWYMLGLTKVWLTLHNSPFASLPGMDALRTEATRIADRTLHFIQPEGLWACFLDQPETRIDSSGSAGIAAALVMGVNGGLLAEKYRAVGEQALKALETYLTPDGLLSGVAQHNAGGVALQSGGYRVLSQMGMGLMAQLYAAVHAKRS